MAAPDPVVAINLIPLRAGASIEMFTRFSAELDQPVCLAQNGVEVVHARCGAAPQSGGARNRHRRGDGGALLGRVGRGQRDGLPELEPWHQKSTRSSMPPPSTHCSPRPSTRARERRGAI